LGTLALPAQVKNLSRHGLYLASEMLDNEGAEVSVSIDLPARKVSLQLAGQVVRRGQGGMAIAFSPLGKHAQRDLANFLLQAQSA